MLSSRARSLAVSGGGPASPEVSAAIASGQVTAVPILDAAGALAQRPWLLGLFGEPGHPLLIVHGYDDA